MNTQENKNHSNHKFPQDEQCFRIICAITMFGGGSDHVHCEKQPCNAMRITGLEEAVSRA